MSKGLSEKEVIIESKTTGFHKEENKVLIVLAGSEMYYKEDVVGVLKELREHLNCWKFTSACSIDDLSSACPLWIEFCVLEESTTLMPQNWQIWLLNKLYGDLK